MCRLLISNLKEKINGKANKESLLYKNLKFKLSEKINKEIPYTKNKTGNAHKMILSRPSNSIFLAMYPPITNITVPKITTVDAFSLKGNAKAKRHNKLLGLIYC